MTILVVGDSFTAPNPAMRVWPTILAARLGLPVVNRALGSCGYLNGGLPGAVPNRFSRQLLAHRDLNPADVRLVILFGSINDRWWLTDHLRSTIWATHREMAREYPTAQHLIVGPQWAGPNPIPGEVDAMRGMILEAMLGYDWRHGYVDPNPPGDPGRWWFPPHRRDLVGPDLFHPNQAGQDHLANMIEPHARRALGL